MTTPVYRWLERYDDINVWQAVVPTMTVVNASCAEQYEFDQVTTPRLMGYIVDSWNSHVNPVESATASDFAFEDPPPDWVNPVHRD